jgi:hypothetical protein
MPVAAAIGVSEGQLVYPLEGDATDFFNGVSGLLSQFVFHSEVERSFLTTTILSLARLYREKEAKHLWITLGYAFGAALNDASSFGIVDAELEFDSFAYSISRRHEDLHQQQHVAGETALEVELAKDNIVFLRFGSRLFSLPYLADRITAAQIPRQ